MTVGGVRQTKRVDDRCDDSCWRMLKSSSVMKSIQSGGRQNTVHRWIKGKIKEEQTRRKDWFIEVELPSALFLYKLLPWISVCSLRTQLAPEVAQWGGAGFILARPCATVAWQLTSILPCLLASMKKCFLNFFHVKYHRPPSHSIFAFTCFITELYDQNSHTFDHCVTQGWIYSGNKWLPFLLETP